MYLMKLQHLLVWPDNQCKYIESENSEYKGPSVRITQILYKDMPQ